MLKRSYIEASEKLDFYENAQIFKEKIGSYIHRTDSSSNARHSVF
jgi:hypothetical protein